MNQEEIKTAIAVLDEVSNAHLRFSEERTDMLKDSFRRDAQTLEKAAAILGDYQSMRVKEQQVAELTAV